MTAPSSVPAGRFEIVRSIIHQCPALKLPQSFVERLGGVAQIVALKGATNEFAEHVADCLNASVPAQGEAMEVLRELLGAWTEWSAALFGGNAEAPAARMDAALDRARALVAASPCAAQPQDGLTVSSELLREARDNCEASIVEDGISDHRKQYRIDLRDRLTAALGAKTTERPKEWDGRCVLGHCGSPSGCEDSGYCRADAATQTAQPAAAQGGQQPVAEVRLTLGMPIIEWVGRDYPVGTKLYTAPAPAAQGGQQPAGVTFPMPDKPGLTMACFDAQTVPVRTPLYTAPAAPAAPLTEKDMEKLWLRETDKHSISQWAAFSLIRAVEAFHGITLAGTAQKGGE